MLVAGCGGSSDAPPATLSFHSRPDLHPPVVDVATSTAPAAGYVFIAPKKSALQQGPEIVDDQGQPVWFGPVSQQALDFRVQRYQGRPVLTYWEGPTTSPVLGTGLGHGVILDRSYRRIARIDCSFGHDTCDLHELKLTPRGTALVTAVRVVPADLSSVGGPVHGKTVDGIFEEIDVATGKVLFSWHSLGHIGLDEAEFPPPPKSGKGSDAPYDYFHINSVEKEKNGNFLISARNSWGVYEISRRTGKVVWRLGGKKSDFTMGPGTQFSWQHDARRQPDGTITLFDDASAPPEEKQSRALRIRLDTTKMTATLVHAYTSPARPLTGSQGNMQVLRGGHVFVGWGAIPRLTEFTPGGRVVWEATFPADDDSYRAYRFRWSARPKTRPSIAVGDDYRPGVVVYASWNGATAVRSWRVVGGITRGGLKPLGPAVPRSGFETVMSAKAGQPLYAVQALDAKGRVLATSPAVPVGSVAIG